MIERVLDDEYAEAFELNQYGTAVTADDLKNVFPTFK